MWVDRFPSPLEFKLFKNVINFTMRVINYIGIYEMRSKKNALLAVKYVHRLTECDSETYFIAWHVFIVVISVNPPPPTQDETVRVRFFRPSSLVQPPLFDYRLCENYASRTIVVVVVVISPESRNLIIDCIL